MKRKISILTLSLLFFASTTGLPLTVHLCKMMKTGSAGECPMHHSNDLSCWNSNDYKFIIYSQNPDCCQTKTIDHSLTDSFVNPKVDFKLLTVSSLFLMNSSIYLYEQRGENFLDSSDTSPPPIFNNIYIINSSFLI